MVLMRDGTRLATDVYLPNSVECFPVILERTPYGRRTPSTSEVRQGEPRPQARAEVARRFTSHGYAVVYQDCRGRYESEGKFVKYLSDGDDGFDTCSWIRAQPWCDGRICTMGFSYSAHAQASLGSLNPPGLTAQIIDCGGFANAWTSGIRQNGAFELRQATWAYKQAILAGQGQPQEIAYRALKAEDISSWFTRLPWRKNFSPLRHYPEYESYLLEQWSQGTFDDYWRQVGLWCEGFYNVYSKCACVHISSWFDPYALTATSNFVGLRAANRGPQRLLLGPWMHGKRSATTAGDVDFGVASTIDSWAGDWAAYRLRFFDWAVHGCVDPEPIVRAFVMGGGSGRRTEAGRLDHGGRWITSENWPLPNTNFSAFYLHANGKLDPSLPESRSAGISYCFDPSNPVPTIGGNISSLDPIADGGSWDQVEMEGFYGCKPPYLPLSSRSDVLVFQTELLTQPVQVIGPLEITLWVSTDGPDTDFTAKLIDVHPPSDDYPSGYAMLLSDGILRLRYAESPTLPRLRPSGEVTRIKFVLPPTANLFAAHHRIRVDISSSNFPKFDVNPNTGEPEGTSRRSREAINTVYTNLDRPSHILLPIVPLSAP
jgi:uncharacterized protein